jgi:hypothetical protein
VRARVAAAQGFRVARLRNLAIAATTCDYLVFIDGDMLLHPSSSPITRASAATGFIPRACVRMPTNSRTRQLIADPAQQPGFWSPGFGGLRRAYLLHSPPMASLTRRFANAVHRHQGVQPGYLA